MHDENIKRMISEVSGLDPATLNGDDGVILSITQLQALCERLGIEWDPDIPVVDGKHCTSCVNCLSGQIFEVVDVGHCECHTCH